MRRRRAASSMAASRRSAVAAPPGGAWWRTSGSPSGPTVVVVVRDDGVGIADGRLAAATGDGHRGISSSIRARVGETGGSATLHTAPGQGVEWELALPRPEEVPPR